MKLPLLNAGGPLQLYLLKTVLKNPTLILLRGSPVDPNPHFLGSGAREN